MDQKRAQSWDETRVLFRCKGVMTGTHSIDGILSWLGINRPGRIAKVLVGDQQQKHKRTQRRVSSASML